MNSSSLVFNASVIHALVDQLLSDLSTPLDQLEAARLLHSGLNQLAGPSALGSQETTSRFGKALAAVDAGNCLVDHLRTRLFLKAVDAQIRDLARAGTVKVLYAGCGPFATLMLPLLGRLGDLDLRIEAWDCHRDSVDALGRIMSALAIPPDRLIVRQADALTAWPVMTTAPNLIIAEVMQRALTREPQVAIMARLGRDFPKARFVPRQIDLRLIAMDPGVEFSFDQQTPERVRVDLGWAPVFVPNLLGQDPVVCAGLDQAGDALAFAGDLTVPELPSGCDTLAVLTRVELGNGLELGDYDSGITQPLLMQQAGRLKTGQRLRCGYRMSADPGPVVERLD